MIEREGPIGLLVTTTAINLHPENETRLFSLSVSDSREQTKEVLRSLAAGNGQGVDLTPWHALQTWLEKEASPAVIPFAEALAEMIPPVAVRLRRDFGALLSLIEVHALLHHANRKKEDGAIVASLEDYATVRELVADLIAEGVEATVKPEIRETVQAVEEILEEEESAMAKDLARVLRLDKGSASRRARGAIERGYLVNLEDR